MLYKKLKFEYDSLFFVKVKNLEGTHPYRTTANCLLYKCYVRQVTWSILIN